MVVMNLKLQLSSSGFLDYFFKTKNMYRRSRFQIKLLLACDCSFGRRLLVEMFGSFLAVDVNKRINPEEGC